MAVTSPVESPHMLFWAARAVAAGCDARPARAYEKVAALLPAGDFHEKQGRSTGLYYLEGADGPQPIYLKKYYRLPWRMRWFAPLGRFPGPRELKLLQTAAALGILVPEPLLAGADRRHACRSFLAIRELTGFAPLHQYIPERFAAPCNALDAAHKQAISRRVADIARRLHGAHWYHRDFYLCHLFIRVTGPSPDAFELAMIDFGRLKHSHRARWRIKDLAELLFSADVPGLTRTDCLRFLKHYLQQPRLDRAGRQLARRLMRKASGYRRHNAGA